MSARLRALWASTWADGAIAALLCVVYVTWLVATAGSIGYARDEGFYFHAADVYGRWLDDREKDPARASERAHVDAAFKVNSEHPSLMKLLFALSHRELFVKRHWFREEGTSYRFPGMAMGGLAVGLVYLAAARLFRRARTSLPEARLAALVASLALALLPRFFHHAHLACFDVPIVAVWLLSALAWLHALERGGVAAPVLTGLAFGLALDTKHNSWFLPIAAACHLAVLALHAGLLSRDGTLLRTRLLRGGAALLAMALLGPLVLRALWPWLWWDPWQRFQAYAAFHLQHEYYNMELFGQNHWEPPMPRAYAPVMTLATVPLVILALAGLGGASVLAVLLRPFAAWLPALARLGRASPLRPVGLDAIEGPGLFVWIGLTMNYAAWVSPTTPIFGGTKHWMTAYPFLALFAGAGAVLVLRAIRRAAPPRLHRLAQLAAVAAIGVAPLVMTARSTPWGLSFYTPLVGGPSGAATLGLNRSFWGYTTGSVAAYLNREAPKGARVYVHDTAAPAWEMLLRDGRLRKDLRAVWTPAGADFVLYHHELHMEGQEYQAWGATGTVRPDFVAGIDGVPVVWVYRRRP